MIIVNGAPDEELAGGVTVRALLDGLGIAEDARGVAVAVEAEVVPRAEWMTVTVDEGARVEVLVAVQGG